MRNGARIVCEVASGADAYCQLPLLGMLFTELREGSGRF